MAEEKKEEIKKPVPEAAQKPADNWAIIAISETLINLNVCRCPR